MTDSKTVIGHGGYPSPSDLTRVTENNPNGGLAWCEAFMQPAPASDTVVIPRTALDEYTGSMPHMWLAKVFGLSSSDVLEYAGWLREMRVYEMTPARTDNAFESYKRIRATLDPRRGHEFIRAMLAHANKRWGRANDTL